MEDKIYLKCECSDPGSDYVRSLEIIDIDDTGFTVWVNRSSDSLGREGSPDMRDSKDSFDRVVKRRKEWQDEYRPAMPYPDWFNHEHKVEIYKDDYKNVYAAVFTKERINVPFEFIKEHTDDNNHFGYYVRRPYWDSATDYDKELFRVLGEWITNVGISDKYESFTKHTWSLD